MQSVCALLPSPRACVHCDLQGTKPRGLSLMPINACRYALKRQLCALCKALQSELHCSLVQYSTSVWSCSPPHGWGLNSINAARNLQPWFQPMYPLCPNTAVSCCLEAWCAIVFESWKELGCSLNVLLCS